MATATETNPPAKDPKGLSSLDEMNLEKSILRRGLATAQEVEACKSYRAKKLAANDESKSLLDIMVEARVLTKNQSVRIRNEIIGETSRKLEIPGYQIIEKLGKGSMGIVYKGRQIAVDRIVAVKILLDALAQNKEFIKRFDREAKIVAKLSHNNIVNAIDAGEVNGYHYFVMEYVEGHTIKDELDKHTVFDEKNAIEIVMAVAEALKHAHQRGLIHRDIKPENVILTKDGGVKLADLGLARLTADEKWVMSEAGMAIGTPYYISPEQVRGQVDVDIRSDIYSLGATLYHMVTGIVPYSGDTPQEVMRKHVDKNTYFTPPDHVNTNLSAGMGMVVETMMAKNRENRYRNPDDLILDLKCLLQGESPMIAAQKPDALAALVEGDAEQIDEHGMSEAQMVEVAGFINSRNQIIAALAALLALSVVTNVIFLARARLIASSVCAVVGPTPPPPGAFARVDRVGDVWVAHLDGEPLVSASDTRSVLKAISDYDRIKISLDCQSDDWIVVRETLDPPWRAELDGETVAVEPYRGTFLAVAVPAGRHELVLRYDPPEVRAALVGSLSALAAIVFALTGFCPFRSTRIITLGLGRSQASELESDSRSSPELHPANH